GMILEDAYIVDLVDTIEYQLKQYARADERRDKQHRRQPPAIAAFYAQIRRLTDILDKHIVPEEKAEYCEPGGALTSADSAVAAPGGHCDSSDRLVLGQSS